MRRRNGNLKIEGTAFPGRRYDTGCGTSECRYDTKIECDKAKAEAIRAGRALLRRLRGIGWTVRVWENLGWHYAASRGILHVFESQTLGSKPAYWTLMGYAEGGGRPEWTEEGRYFDDPNAAVKRQLVVAQKSINRLVSDFNSAAKGLL